MQKKQAEFLTDCNVADVIEFPDRSFLVILISESRSTRNAAGSILKGKVSFCTASRLLESELLPRAISEGHSLKRGKPVCRLLKTRSLCLVSYNLENLSHSRKTLFGYALKGRKGQEGTLDLLGGQPVGRSSVLVPLERIGDLREFMKYWGVRHSSRRIIEVGVDNQQ
ncbi:MAG: hypothetical protein ABH879_06350 [archaeon]